MKTSPKIAGLLQATGLVAYVVVFALLANVVREWAIARSAEPEPVLAMTLFLLAFVTSALICASIVFAYPVALFFDGQKRAAVEVVFWSAAWLVVFVFALGIFSLSASAL